MMKRILDLLAICAIGLAVAVNAVAQEATPIDQLALNAVGGRRALVGPNCLINQISTSANVATNYSYLNAVTDEDLNNYATITGVQVGVGANPIFSVKDTKHTYKGGTQAGFRILSSEGGGLLSLDVIKMFSIKVFNDGKEQGVYPIENNGTGLNLSLIKIPNSDHISVDLEITPENDFDELYLMVNGVEVSAIQELSIKYAYVGASKEYPLTYNGVKQYANGFAIDDNKCHSMPWLWKNVKNTILDEDLTNKLSTGGIAIGEWAHMQIGVNNSFPKGTEVGFKYSSAGLLNLSLGGFTTITLYKNGKKVQTETLKADVLNLGVASSGETKTSVIAQADFDAARLTIGAGVLSVDLGEAAGIYYGYIKKQPDVEHHCPINASVSSTLCENVKTYELKSNPNIDVTWDITAEPEGSTVTLTGNQVSGLTTGTYEFTATAGSQCPYADGHKCQETVTLQVGNTGTVNTSCAQPLTNTTANGAPYALSNQLHDTSGSLLSISNLKNGQHILDEKENNYATYVGGLSVANDLGIIGLKTKDGRSFGQEIATEGDRRIGFIVENASTFLNADVLQFFQIRLYRNGVRLKGDGIPEVIDESNTVDVGLIGAEKSQKVRFSIRVPKEIEFDEFQLWKSGVLDLGLGTLRIYFGFIEDADAHCSDPVANNCGVVFSSETTHARFAPVIPFQTASVAMVLSHAEYLIDDDLSTAMNYHPTVSVGSGMTFSVKLGKTLDNKQQLGVVIDSKTYLAGVKVGTWMTLETYLNGKKTGEKFDNWGTVGLDVIGYGDKKFLLQTPQLPYDEVCLTFAGIAELLNGYQIYGLFFRGDQDGDGLPDCSDPDLCNNNLSDLTVTHDICLGDVIRLSGVANFDCPENTTKTLQYKVTYQDLHTTGPEEELGTIDITKDSSLPSVFEKEFTPTKEGEFVLSLSLIKTSPEEEDDNYDGATNDLYFTVHPKQTTWKSSTADPYHWNAWDNWDKGSPWNCTDVIIPKHADGNYPVLAPGEYNACHFIHFCPESEVVNTHYLDYQKAWIETELSPNRYYLLAIPLKEMRSGDWFIAKDPHPYPNYFEVLDNRSYPENRVTPTVYQRLWEAKAYNRTINGGREIVYPAETHWTKPSNMLSEYYDAHHGFALSLWVHPLTPEDTGAGTPGQTYLFRFPKEHEKYFYYDPKGHILEHSEQTQREDSQVGRFIYEDSQKQVKFPLQERLHTLRYQNNTYLVGNPFMSHIDVKTFLQENPDVTSVKVYNGNANNSLILSDGDLITSISGGAMNCTQIAPLESFFVTFKDNQEELDERYVTFTEQMLCLGKAVNKAAFAPRHTEGTIRLHLNSDAKEAGAVIVLAQDKNDGFVEQEDVEMLMDPKDAHEFSVFTIADNKALDIQQRHSAEMIPLGFYCPTAMALVEMEIELPVNFKGWVLKDQLMGNEYGLSAGKKNTLLLNHLSTNAGRFYLTQATSAQLMEKGLPYAYQQQASIVVRCEEREMARCECFSVDGKRMACITTPGKEYLLRRNKGVNLIKVTLTDGSCHTIKLNCQ